MDDMPRAITQCLAVITRHCVTVSLVCAALASLYLILVHRHCGGSVSKLQPSLTDLLSLQRPARAATLLFVVNAPTGMLTGEAVFSAAQLGRLDMNIKAKLLQVSTTSLHCWHKLFS